MKNISVNFNQKIGKVKPMHAVNNGPYYKFGQDQRISNLHHWVEAGIPYSRLHDAPLGTNYGGAHVVDVNLIFPNFDADPYLPESYDFACTDEYLRVIDYSGTKIFYRLGASIEHEVKKYHTLPPKDFKKWAIICEHIIRHYTEGWADGFRYDIEYWEIWNEPDLDADDTANKRTWGGTKAQFFDFYEVAAKYLKTTFPHLKIGGPSCSGNMEWMKDFLAEMKRRDVPLDFFSWHRYAYEPDFIIEIAYQIRQIMDEAGYTEAESINNEWNYVRGWAEDEYRHSMRTQRNIKGASFVHGTICASQYAPVDLLMYYDARPCRFNGMFDYYMANICLKGYYPFKMFNELYKLGNCTNVQCDRNLFACAAVDGDKAAFTFTYYCDDETTPTEDIKLSVVGFAGQNGVKASYYLLDEDKDLELVREEVLSGESYSTMVQATLYSSYLVILERI